MTALISADSSVKSNTYEKAAYEIACLLQIAQADTSKNPGEQQYIAITQDLTSRQVNINFSLPLTSVRSGNITGYQVKNEILISPWLSAGEFTGGHAAQDFFNLIQKISEFESIPAKNPANENRLTWSITDSPLVCAGSIVLPLNLTIPADVGTLITSVNNYLL